MLKAIELKGFENTLNSKLEFVEGINVITGVTNSGKSSIVKAIQWLVENEPSGDGFLYNKEVIPCQVIGEFDNDIIEKYKDENNHYYKINNKDIYTALRQNVPEQIKEITKFSEMNIQSQFDKFFLLQDTSGEVARKLNSIINLSVMDNSIKKVKSKVYQKNKDIEYLEQETIKLKDDLKKYDWLDNVEILINDIEKGYNLFEVNNKKIQSLKELNNNYKQVNENLIEIDKKLQYKNKLDTIKKQYTLLKEKKNKKNSLEILLQQLNSIKQDLKKYKNIFDKKEKVNKLKIDFEIYIDIKDKLSLLNDSVNINKQILFYSQNLIKQKNELKDILKNIKLCPFFKKECPLNKGDLK